MLAAFERQVQPESIQVREDSQQLPQRYPDLILSLLRLYDQGDQYLDTFLDTLHQKSLNADLLDYKLTWLVFSFLSQEKGVFDSKRERVAAMEKRLVRNMVDQLSSLGLHHQAVMVISMASSLSWEEKQPAIQRVLTQAYCSNKSVSKDIKLLGLPEEMVHLAQAISHQRRGALRQAIDSYIQADHLEMADSLVSHQVGLEIIVAYWHDTQNNTVHLEYLSTLIQRLDAQRHKIPQWKRGTGYLKKIVKLLTTGQWQQGQARLKALSRSNYLGPATQITAEFRRVVNQLLAMYSPIEEHQSAFNYGL